MSNYSDKDDKKFDDIYDNEVFASVNLNKPQPSPDIVPSLEEKEKEKEFELEKKIYEDDLSLSIDEDNQPTGKWTSACAHITCAMIGTGVLALAEAFRYLSWYGGPIILLISFIITYYISRLLSKMHINNENNMRRNSYKQMGKDILGSSWNNYLILPCLYLGVFFTTIAYLVTAGENISAIYSSYSDPSNSPHIRQLVWTSIIALIQMVLALFSNLDDLKGMSFFGIFASLIYASIATILSILLSGNEAIEAKKAIQQPPSTIDTIFNVFMGLTTIAFAFGFQSLQPNIMGTLSNRPGTISPRNSMNKGLNVSYAFVFIVYYAASITGYYTFGNLIDGDILIVISKNIQNDGQKYAITIAQVFVILHVVIAYQLFAHIAYAVLENKVIKIYGSCSKLVSISMRWAFILCTWFIAILLGGFFGQIMALAGAISNVPITFVVPCIMYLSHAKATGKTISNVEKAVLYLIIVVSSVVGILGIVSSVRSIIINLPTYSLFV